MEPINETLGAENKSVPVAEKAHWTWDVIRSVAALYNSNGGVLRMGVDDSGKVVGGHDLKDYHTDGSEFATTLADFLDFPPPFKSIMRDEGYVEIMIQAGVVVPTILRRQLDHFASKTLRHNQGTLFVRAYTDGRPSSRPPVSRAEWQATLHTWEMNRGAGMQAQILFQFMLLINNWDPFDPRNTDFTRHQAKCVADIAKTFGRLALWEGLRAIVEQVALSEVAPPANAVDRDLAGSRRKQPVADHVNRLAVDLGLGLPDA